MRSLPRRIARLRKEAAAELAEQSKPTLSKDQALLLVTMHEIDTLLRNEEEVELLEENHPELLEAYRALVKVSKGK